MIQQKNYFSENVYLHNNFSLPLSPNSNGNKTVDYEIENCKSKKDILQRYSLIPVF
jgi:hypothetical protein